MFTGFITNEILFVVIFAASLILIGLEFFVPSFGILGITGGYLLIESILSIDNFSSPGLYILLGVLIALVALIIIVKYFVKHMDSNKLVLNSNMARSKGNGPKFDVTDLAGREGVVYKTLRPSGEVEIDGRIFEAVSFGDYISKGAKIRVEKVVASKIYCKQI